MVGYLFVDLSICQIHFAPLIHVYNICLFDLIIYIPVNNFLIMLGGVFLGWTSTKQGFNVSC